jgi:predicted dinucleotide-binding enzyme
MVEPGRVRGDHDLFVAGNDAGAKAQVVRLLKEEFGWKNVNDVGDITAARAMEAYLHLWLRLYGALQTADFNVHVAR